MVKASRPFVIMAKPVGSHCNMRCGYCYYLDKGRFSKVPDQARMTFALLEKFIKQYIAASPGPTVSFTWHGGEPTLAGLDFYRQVVALQKRYLPKGWSCWNSLQTNGLLLDDEWCTFLADNHFDVGLSIDGAEAVHDYFRRDAGGNPTYHRARIAVERLKAHGIKPDLLCTVTEASAAMPLEVYKGLRELDTGWLQFIPIVVRTAGTVTAESVTPEGYGRFLCTVFDEWISHDLGKIDVQFFAETAKVWAGGSASLCWMAPVCGTVLVVEEDGSIYSCDHFVDPEHRIGTLSDDMGVLVDSTIQRDFGESKHTMLTKQCRVCKWLDVCGGGCLKDRFSKTDEGEEGLYYLCHGLSMFFDHARRPLRQIMNLSRRGLKPNEIMTVLNIK